MTIGHSEFSLFRNHRGTVIVADDDPISVELISRALADIGWQIRPAKNGREVLKIVDAGRVDALILDMRMPELDGYEVCLSLLRRGRKIPTLVITGCIGDSEPLGYLNVCRTVTKPVQSQDMLDFLNHATAESNRRDEFALAAQGGSGEIGWARGGL